MLEVQHYVDHVYIHLGYMDMVFETSQEACYYYDTYNPHMRSLFDSDTYTSLSRRQVSFHNGTGLRPPFRDPFCSKPDGRSDIDPTTNYRFVVREYDGERLSICKFHKNYAPNVTRTTDTYFNRVISMSTKKLDRKTIYRHT